jgi:hypothetical protein
MRKLDGILMITIVAAVAASSHSALAKGDKSTSNLLKNTATGKHYNNTVITTPHKPMKPVTEQKASKKSGNTGKGPNGNPNSTGASAGKGPNDNPNSTGASAGKGPNNNPNSTGASAGPKLTPEKVEGGGENIQR